MTRYFTKPRTIRVKAEWWDDEPFRHIPTVCDHEPTDTGLPDANGDTIWRAPNGMGFQFFNQGE